MASGYPPDWERRKRATHIRNDWTCQECGGLGGPNGSHELHAHHIVPLSEGGSNDLDNLVTLCAGCHSETHGRPIGSALFAKSEPSGRDWKWGGPIDHGIVALATGWWSFGAGNAVWSVACRIGSMTWNPLKWGRSKDGKK